MEASFEPKPLYSPEMLLDELKRHFPDHDFSGDYRDSGRRHHSGKIILFKALINGAEEEIGICDLCGWPIPLIYLAAFGSITPSAD